MAAITDILAAAKIRVTPESIEKAALIFQKSQYFKTQKHG